MMPSKKEDNIGPKGIENRARELVMLLRSHGFEAYFVGGCVRDMVLQTLDPRPQITDGGQSNVGVGAARPTDLMSTESENTSTHSDIDIATSAKPEDIERLFKRTIPVGKQFGVMLVVIDGIEFEVATFRSDGMYLDGRHPESVHFSSAEEDVKRRDFTINGLLYDPISEKIIDYVAGEKDIRQKVLRAIGDPRKRFHEDKLRVLRAVRFATRFQFKIEEETLSAVKEYAAHITQVSIERIREELVKMFTGPHPGSALRLLDETGVLALILPEVAEMKGVPQNPQFHPEGDVFVHTALMMDKLSYPSVVLAFSSLFHDVGKPRTTDRETLKSPFHSEVGAKMTEEIMRRLRFSNEEIDQTVWCVRNHMNFMHVQQMREGKLKRMMARETFADELELHKIDCLSSHGMIDNYEFLIAKQAECTLEDLQPERLLTGNDLISMGMKPGPRFKEILDEAWTLQLEHAFPSREAALQWMKEHYGSK